MSLKPWSIARTGLVLSCAAVLSACAPSSYLIKKPTPLALAGATQSAPDAKLTVIDQRKGAERDFSTGILMSGLRTDAGPVQPVGFLAEHLQAELKARGLATEVTATGNAQPALYLQTFRVVNHRSNGFAPFITFTFLSADLDTPSGKKRLTAFVKRGKVPVWSFDEVIEPTFNQPISLAIKELAAKLSAQAYGWRASDAQVDALLAKLKSPNLSGDAYLDVYALGFSNHPRAVERMVQLSSHADEYVRMAAISSLGILGASSQFATLKSIYEKRDVSWTDRAMAIKALGDLGTPESQAFLAQELTRWESAKTDKESLWTAQVIRLFL